MQRIILSIQEEEQRYSLIAAARILHSVVDQMSADLEDLETTIQDSIPTALRGSDLGKIVATRLLKEQKRLQKVRADTPLWRFLLDTQTWAGQQLTRDLRMTSKSVKTVITISMKLEDLRANMVTFRNNLVLFKVRLQHPLIDQVTLNG